MQFSTEVKKSIPYKYAAQVRAGKIVTGKKIALAVERFFTWIENTEQKGYFLDHAAGIHVINFFPLFLLHTSGAKAGQPFELSPYQQFTLYNIFAWKKLNPQGVPVRVIKTVYEKVARKNGKTAMLAGLGLYCQICEGEGGPQIFVGATKKEQSFILWKQARDFIEKNPVLRSDARLELLTAEIRSKLNNGTFKYLGANSPTMDGLNPSVSIIDEYHAHKDDAVREVLESAMGARLQPLIYIITTAGVHISGVCKAYEDVVTEILEGRKEDDSTFIMIHDLDKGDNWEDLYTWQKANPNLGVSISMDYLQAEYVKAVNQPSKAPNFKTKHLNQWVDAPQIWIPSEVWRAAQVDEITAEAFKKFGAYAAVDLSATEDITALAILSEPDSEDNRYLKIFLFCPRENIDSRSKTDRVPYRAWSDAGHIIATEGNQVDYDRVKDKILEHYFTHNIKRVEFDKWNATHLVNQLQDTAIKISYFGQGIGNISAPTKEFYRQVYNGKIKHEGNPVMEWMLSGCQVVADASNNIKIHKGKSNSGPKRVDGIIAAIMALGGSMTDKDSKGSKYNRMQLAELEEKN